MSSDPAPAEASAPPGGAWSRFWNRGGWWRAVLVTVIYAALYLGIGRLSGRLFGGFIDAADPTGSPASALLGVALPILVGGLLLLAFSWSVGWLPGLFRRQALRGRPWMWVAVVLVVIPILVRVAATGWSRYSVALVLSILFIGVCVGFTEELLTRGINVRLLRRGGHSERVVLVISAGLFAALHITNVFSGQPGLIVAVTVVYTFGFGAMMYLSLRATGRLAWVMVLHAATDPTTILATGGIDTHGSTAGSGELIGIAGLFNIAYVIFALLAVIIVRERSGATDQASRSTDDHRTPPRGAAS